MMDRARSARSLHILGAVAAAPAGPACGSPGPDGTACTELSPRHAELEAAGWTRRFAAAPPRLEEMSLTYREMGFAVLHEPLDDRLLDDGCAGCAPARAGFRVIYTRTEP